MVDVMSQATITLIHGTFAQGADRNPLGLLTGTEALQTFRS